MVKCKGSNAERRYWIRLRISSRRQLVANFHQHLASDVNCYVAGDPEQIPFAGVWSTVDGYDQFWGLFFKMFARPDKKLYFPTIISSGNTCVAIGREQVQMREMKLVAESWVTIKFEFQRGKIIEIEDYFDTAVTAKAIADAATNDDEQ